MSSIVSRLSLLALLLGCGGDGSAALSGESAEALADADAPSARRGYDCSALIQPAEIDNITGMSGARLTSNTRGEENEILPGHTQCGYALPQDYALAIDVYEGGEAMETFEVVWLGAQNMGGESVSGIGDAALLFMNAGNPIVVARAGGRGVRVIPGGGQGLGVMDGHDLATRVASAVVGRL